MVANKNNKNSWYRSYHGMVSDDKWPLIARKSGQNVAAVVAVWCALLECASQAQERGRIDDFDPESMDANLGLEDGACERILEALQGGKFPRIVDGRLVSWDKRQPLRERADDKSSTDRVREWREKQKAGQGVDGTFVDCGNGSGVSSDVSPCNDGETPRNANETPCNAHIRGEERRGEENLTGGGNSTVGYGAAGSLPTPHEGDGSRVHAWVAGDCGVLDKDSFVEWLDRAHSVRPVWLKSRMNQVEREAALEAFRCCGGFSEEDWRLLAAFYQAKPIMDRNGKEKFWRPTGRKKFFEDLGDVLGNALSWAKETKWKKARPKANAVNEKPKAQTPALSDEEFLAIINEMREVAGKPLLTMEEFKRGDFI